jgi:hypothetical protein
MDIIFRCGCLTLLEALQAHDRAPSSTATRLPIHQREIVFNPSLSFATDVFDEPFWQALAAYPLSISAKAP